MRSVTLVVALALLAGACGSPAEQGSDGEPADATVSPPATSTTAPDTATSTTTTSPTGDTQPRERPPGDKSQAAYPEDGFPSEDDLQPRLSIEDALLPDDAFGEPWEPQWRQLDAIGYGAGPNQTDCDEYWAYEELLGGDGGHVLWWTDGGNANHRVTRIASQPDALARLVSLGALADNCPVVNWNEGGSFTVELFTPDVEAFIMRFDERASGEITWVAITLFGDLVSVLQMPLWTRADGTMLEVTVDDIAAIADEMARRVQNAGPDRTPTPTTTTPTTTAPTPTTNPKLPTIVTPPPLIDVPPTTVVPLDEIGALLLTADEAPPWLQLNEVDPSTPGGSDDEFVEACPAADSLNEIDRALTWQADFETLEGAEALQLIGEMDDANAASDVAALFAQVASCDLATFIPGAAGSGGLVEIGGADVAATLFIETQDLVDSRLELGVAAIGSIIVVFTIEARYDPATAGDQMREFMSLGVDKIAAVRP